ncbi:phage tail protein [Pedomonas mirosovicensis]|uniref:phage tail protein n=1 Tax=Pedomonas mirosovicensis TaxID=2908641 RepID=UPI0021676D3A|nr:phage tail protein [Pedomonas mirosovicensis]MCH8686451.1 phage tail protein [Pedomonas mirosovicensis]
MLMALGQFVFSLSTLAHQDLSHRLGWRHEQSSRVGTRDANQFLGPGEETISLSGLVAPELMDGRASLDTLRNMADQGEAWPLVDGTGRVFGSFVITGLDERQSLFNPDGTARRIEFGLELRRVDDTDAAARIAGGQ